MRSPVPADRLRGRVADSLGLAGARWPDVAAAVLEARGRSGLDRGAFARRAGVEVSTLTRAETGNMPRDQLPGPLRRLVPH